MFKKIIQLFVQPSLLDMKMKQLHEAKVALLNAQTGLDFAKATVDYHTAVINRLTVDIDAEINGINTHQVANIHPIQKRF